MKFEKMGLSELFDEVEKARYEIGMRLILIRELEGEETFKRFIKDKLPGITLEDAYEYIRAASQ